MRLRFVEVRQDDALAKPLIAELATEYATRYNGTREKVWAGCRATRPRSSRRRTARW
jgi:hypothetical protein